MQVVGHMGGEAGMYSIWYSIWSALLSSQRSRALMRIECLVGSVGDTISLSSTGKHLWEGQLKSVSLQCMIQL